MPVPDDYERAARLFKEALELSSSSRDDYINASAAGDESLARRVRRMIGYIEKTNPTVDLISSVHHDRSSTASHNQLIGATIGWFRIVEIMGEGGFGIVYRAEQEEPVRRSVAMKILSASSVTGRTRDVQQVVARFEAERQALAMMEHPGIARVIDAGQTDPVFGSRPYIVMELIRGEPITTYCDHHRLDVKSRLQLFITVCQAVQHAHQRGVIHRDLKPSNMLVTEVDGVAVPKIIDFGIAKAVAGGEPLTETPDVTHRLELLGTPQYMSPEQADFDERSIDTRTDVYSLGVVLYELLTGTTPLDARLLRSSSYSGMIKMIQEQKIERPSVRISQLGEEAAREIVKCKADDVPTLLRWVRGELDWIAMKALDGDRERRYSSAAALAEDTERYLEHQPVTAGPPGAAYRLRKFVRRHRISVIGAGVVALALLAGTIMATFGMVRARQSAEEALQINQFMNDVLTSADPNVGHADVRLAAVLHNASVTATRRFAGHPATEARVRDMLGRVFNNLTLFAESITEHRKSYEIWKSIAGPDDPRTLESQLMYARALANDNRSRESHEVTMDLGPRLERVFGPDHRLSLEMQRTVGLNQTVLGFFEDGAHILRQALERARRVNADERQVAGLQDALMRNMMHELRFADSQRAKVVATDLEQLAVELISRCERLFDPESPQTLRARLALAHALWRQGDFEYAADICQNILATSRRRLGECHGVRTDAQLILAWALYRLGEAPAAAELTLQELQCSRIAGNPLIWLGHLYEALPLLDRGGRWQEGEAAAREASEMLREYGGGHGGMQIGADSHIARFVSLQGRLEEADQLFADLIRRLQNGEAEDEPNLVARVTLHYAAHLMKRGDFQAAERHLQEVARLQGDARFGTNDTVPDDVLLEFIALYEALGQPERAASYEKMRQDVLHNVAP